MHRTNVGRLVTVEEHWLSANVNKEFVKIAYENATPAELAKVKFIQNFIDGGIITDLNEKRLAFMDANDIDTQIIGYGNNSPAYLPAKYSVDLCRLANTELGEACRKAPGRLYGYAVVPVEDPDAAVKELERAVKEDGLKGVMFNGVVDGHFYDGDRFYPILEKAAELGVPVYFHPGEVAGTVADYYYRGEKISQNVSTILSGHGIAWHYDTGMIYLRLVLSGIFDKLPDLQFIIGHWGELMSFYFNRMDDKMPRELTGLKKNISEYFTQNMYVTPSGMFFQDEMDFCLRWFSTDRILWSLDYPYSLDSNVRTFLEAYDLPEEDKQKIAHLNAERLWNI